MGENQGRGKKKHNMNRDGDRNSNRISAPNSSSKPGKNDHKKSYRRSYEKYHGRSGAGLMGNAVDYSDYHMSVSEMVTGVAIGMLIGGIATYMIVHKVFFSMAVGFVIGIVYIKPYKSKCIQKRDKELLLEFRDLMESLVSSYSAGGNTISAFESAYTDMDELYGEDSYMAKELEIIRTGLANGFNIVPLIDDMAYRMGLEDIKNFADVFGICFRKGGDMRKVLFDTRQVIGEKIEMEQEMKVALRANMNELNILLVVPVVIDLMFQSDQGLADTGSTMGGLISRLIAVAMFGGAYALGRYFVGRGQHQL